MKGFPWMVAGIGLGATIVYLLFSQSQSPTVSDAVEGAAQKTFGWGTKQQIVGKAQAVVGAVKQGVGRLSESPSLEDEGSADRIAGNTRNAVGRLGEEAGRAIHDLNS